MCSRSARARARRPIAARTGSSAASSCALATSVSAESNVAISTPGWKKSSRPGNDSISDGTPHDAAKKARGVIRKASLYLPSASSRRAVSSVIRAPLSAARSRSGVSSGARVGTLQRRSPS
jgi:hypothetical protein